MSGWIAYGDYYATGEGRITVIALGKTEEHARSLFLKIADEFLLFGVFDLEDAPSEWSALYYNVVPEFVEAQLTKAWDSGAYAEYSTKMHINYS